MTSPLIKCQTCRFFCQEDEVEVELGLGVCRRYPPTLGQQDIQGGEDTCNNFPQVYEDSWCGEWKQIEG